MDEKKQIEEMARIICESSANKADCDKCGFHRTCSKFDDATNLYNANYRKQSEWISVDERLPEKEEIVLCCLGLVQNVYTYKGDNIWEDSYGYYQKDEPITHWMPLPEPPKGE